MKWIAAILLIYTTALWTVACSDGKRSNDGTTTLTEVSHNHDHNTTDNCTPFCHCSCCGISITVVDFTLPELEVPACVFASPEVIIREDSFPSSYSGKIWQPPRLIA